MGKNKAELTEAIQLLINNVQALGAQMEELKIAVRANTLQMHGRSAAKEDAPAAKKT